MTCYIMQYHTTRSGADPVILNLHRFKEDKGEIAALRTKEQGDWKKLTVEEKKVVPQKVLLGS